MLTRRGVVEGIGIGAFAGFCALTPGLAQSRRLTAREVFDGIKKASNQPWNPVANDDRIIFGSRDTPITGIATSFFSSMAVLRQAKEMGLNYIIPHECSFYERYDDLAESALRDDDPTLSAKKKFLLDNNMVIQRMHGHSHSMAGDVITGGLIAQLDWSSYRAEQGGRAVLKIPAASAMAVGRHIKQRAGLRTLRMFGDPNRQISTLSISPGMPGDNSQIAQIETPGVDAVILGEVREPEVLGYAQDLALKRPVNIFFLGHMGEDFGMRLVAEWTAKVFPNMPSRWLRSVDPYTNPV